MLVQFCKKPFYRYFAIPSKSAQTQASFVQKEVDRRRRDGGIVSRYFHFADTSYRWLYNPSVATRQPPLHKGAFFVGASQYRTGLHRPKPPLCKGRWVLHSKTRRDCPTITHTPIRTFLFCRKWKKLFTNPTFCSKIYKSMRINAFAVFSETEGHIIQRKVLSQL